MRPSEFRSILATSDLANGSDEVVRTGANLSACFGANFHILHALEFPAAQLAAASGTSLEQRVRAAETALKDQFARVAPAGSALRSAMAVIQVPHRAILARAVSVGADLIVMGAQRKGGLRGKVLGSTVDRTIGISRVPCLVVHEGLGLPINRIGVPSDFSGCSRDALSLALGFAEKLAGPHSVPEVDVAHVNRVSLVEDDSVEGDTAVLQALQTEIAIATGGEYRPGLTMSILWGDRPAAAIVKWAEEEGLDLLVMGTHGRSGLERALTGSVSLATARETRCPVLLVPPLNAGSQAEPHENRKATGQIERVVIGIDSSPGSYASASWAMRHFAPQAEPTLVRAYEAAPPPALVDGPFPVQVEMKDSPREGSGRRLAGLEHSGGWGIGVREGDPLTEIVAAAEAAAADLIVLGEHYPERLPHDWLAGAAYRVVHRSDVPVLFVRHPPPSAPMVILAAVDESENAVAVLAWSRALLQRFKAQVVAFHSLETTGGVQEKGRVASPVRSWEVEPRTIRECEGRLRQGCQRAGLPQEQASVSVRIGDPSAEILSAARDILAELIVIGSHAPNVVESVSRGGVAASIVRNAPCPVLVIPTLP